MKALSPRFIRGDFFLWYSLFFVALEKLARKRDDLLDGDRIGDVLRGIIVLRRELTQCIRDIRIGSLVLCVPNNVVFVRRKIKIA